MTATGPAPLPTPHFEPAPQRSRLRDFAAFAGIVVIAATLILAIGYSSGTGRNPTRAAPVTGACAADLVQVSPMYHGLTAFVTTTGPDVVTLDVWDGFVHRRATQQVTKRGGGATISMWDFNYDIRRVEVTTKTGGTCEASLEGLNR